jgi:hypothetical protein
MLKPRWIRNIEGHFPQRLADTTEKIKYYARTFGSSINNCSYKVDVFMEEAKKFNEEFCDELNR